jgi:hypothetical protein
MPLRNTMILILISTLISWFGVGAFVLLIQPTDLPLWMLLIFYTAIFLASLGSFTLVGTFIRVYIFKAEVAVRQFTRSIRQGVFFSILVASSLFLSHVGLLSTWSLVLLILGLACIELFFLTSRSRAT